MVSWGQTEGEHHLEGRRGSNSHLTSFRVEELSDVTKQNVEKAKGLVGLMQQQSDANVLYLRCFQLLKLGGLEAEIPRLVVFGQQSMGKTTLLDYIMGGPIGYSSTDTGTKQPVVIMLKPSESNKVECSLGGKPMDIKSLQDSMKDHMSAAGDKISAEELEVEISVPGGVHAVFVDLPGIKDDSKTGAEMTRSVVRGYVQNNPYDLYILVKKASDDPANWPWSLREFILSPAPKGLGLTPKQTVVVGTRAREFLINEKNDVRSQQHLLERVRKRAVTDSNGNPLPLFFLELFSLSIEMKESLDFITKRDAMNQQINEGRNGVLDLLTNSFDVSGSLKMRQTLLDFFDVEKFKRELNVKFQSLLNDQLGVLERRLVRKRLETQKRIGDLEVQVSQQSPQSCREYIKLYLRELLQTVTELVTGNYTIIRLPEAGDLFLSTYGGTLKDNLEEGHDLAVELFPDKDHYDPDFLRNIIAHAEEVFAKSEALRKEQDAASMGLDASQPTGPDGRPLIQPGQLVRFMLSKDNSSLFGLVQSIESPSSASSSSDASSSAAVDGINNPAVGKEVMVTFYFRPANQQTGDAAGAASQEQTQNKSVDRVRLTVLLPLAQIVTATNVPPSGFRCWKRVYRSDGWVGLQGVQLQRIGPSGGGGDAGGTTNNSFGGGEAVVLPVQGSALYGPTQPIDREETVKMEEVFMDAPGEGGGENKLSRTDNLSTTQRIAGEFAETKLLNQLSMTHLGRWLKFHICNLEPDRKFSDHTLLQMMRSVRHVIDKADWEPLVADLLQANVRGGMLQVARLAACAAAAALRRILRASCAEVFRQVQSGDLISGLLFLASNPRFMEELEQALEDYTRQKARDCTNAMRDLIFEQTHAIHFEMIEDFFDGCRQFENDFLGGNLMDDVTRRVKESLAVRKHRLGVADVYARHDNSGTPNNMIYEEVRIQFWVVKMLLAAPLTTKLYMHFVKDIKDKSMHLASEDKYSITCESDLERSLQETILCEKSTTGRYLPRSDDDLMEYYDLSINKDEIMNRILEAKRTEEYVKLALEGVSKLRQQIHKQGGVDFLMRLDLSSGGGGGRFEETSHSPTFSTISPSALPTTTPSSPTSNNPFVPSVAHRGGQSQVSKRFTPSPSVPGSGADVTPVEAVTSEVQINGQLPSGHHRKQGIDRINMEK